MKKRFIIINAVTDEPLCYIESNNGKNALRKFRQGLTSSFAWYCIGKEHIVKCVRKPEVIYTDVWEMFNSYGATFVAVESNLK